MGGRNRSPTVPSDSVPSDSVPSDCGLGGQRLGHLVQPGERIGCPDGVGRPHEPPDGPGNLGQQLGRGVRLAAAHVVHRAGPTGQVRPEHQRPDQRGLPAAGDAGNQAVQSGADRPLDAVDLARPADEQPLVRGVVQQRTTGKLHSASVPVTLLFLQ